MKIKNILTPKWFINLQWLFFLMFVFYFSVNYRDMLYQFEVGIFLLYLAIVGVIMLVHTRYHEGSHRCSANLFGYRAKVVLERKICEFDEDMNIKPFHFSIIAVMPFLVDLAVIKILTIIMPSFTFIIGLFGVYALACSMSDFYLAFSSIRYIFKKKYYFKYVGSSRFELFKSV